MSVTSKHVPACMSAAILSAMLGLLCGCGGGDPGEPVIPPSVTGDPSDQAAAVGETVTFSVTATGSGTILYQWRKDGVDIPDATDPSYTTPSLTSGDDGALFTCVVSNAYGSVESDAAAVVMSVPTITVQPANTTVLERDTASFSVTAAGSGALTYQWRKGVVDVAGATGAGYTTPATALADDGAQFTCIVSNLAGGVTSDVATLTVNMAPPLITAHPADQTVTEGDTATFTVTAIGSGTVTYQWKLDSVDVSGATSATYTTPATVLADDGAQFTCIVSNSAGDVTSDLARLTVYGPPGSLAWAKRAGGSSVACGNGVAALSDNSAVAAGYFQGTVTFGPGEPGQTILTSAGWMDIFIARYNADGTLAWAKQEGGANPLYGDCAWDVVALSDDSTVVTGSIWDTATFGLGEANATTLTSAGGDDIFVARYSADGSLVWARRAGGTTHEYGFDVAALSDDSVAITGSFGGTATFGASEANEVTLVSAGSSDVFVARYNTDGTLAWAKRAGGAGTQMGYGIAALSDGSVVITGYFPGTMTFGPGEPSQTVLTSAGKEDVFIARYDPGGGLAWAKRAGSADSVVGDWGLAVAAFSDDSTAVTGYFRAPATFGPGEPNETTLTAGGAFMARYNADGTLDWAKRTGAEGSALAVLSDDSVVATSDCGTATFGLGEANETTLTGAGGNDIYVACYDAQGMLTWAKRAGGTDHDCGYGVAGLPSGLVVITGYFRAIATFGPSEANQTNLTCAGGSDMFIALYYP